MKINLNNIISQQEIRGFLFSKLIDVENAIFLFAHATSNEFVVKDYRVLELSDFDIQSAYHIQITSKTIGELIKKAHDLGLSLIEIHSHVNQENAYFSWSDWRGFEEFVPHILWRLPGRPYGALVFAESTVDGIYWNNDSVNYEAISSLVDDSGEFFTTGISNKIDQYDD